MTERKIYSKYVKIGTGIGLTSALGLVTYEFFKIRKQINSVVNTRVLDLHKKGPEFIYIKHHIYRKSLEKELKAQQSKNFVNVIIHPFGRWWKKFKHSLAWRLLKMAQEGDHDERIKAIQQLALVDHLKVLLEDWDFQHLAQLCDYRTAIALARVECDLRWFLKPRFYGLKQTPLETVLSLRAILEQMVPNRCIEHALENDLQIHPMRDPEGDTVVDGMRLTKHENEIMTQALEVLLHLTTFKDFCEKFIEARGLEILIEMEKLDQTDINYRLTLCRIVANITEFNDFGYDFFTTGWLGILAKWSRDEDMRVQVTASLALANLDKEDNFPVVYPSKVYPLYPRNERKMQPNVDVIFVHGLLGGVFITWRQKKTMTPEVSSISNTKSNDVLPRKIKKSLHFPDFFAEREESKVEKVTTDEETNDRSETLIPMKQATEETVPNIADTQTQEIIKALKEDEGLGSDWEVVFHDVPVKSSEEHSDSYAVSGDEWCNEESRDEYTYCWPMEWIPTDFPHARIIGLNYESSLTQWYGTNCPCLKNSSQLIPRATEFLNKIIKSGVGERPIVWIGHSMGGLIIKSIIVQASQHQDPKVQNICKNTKGIIFLGTPHKGSPVATLKQTTSTLLWVSSEVQDMKEGNSTLLELNEDFLKLIEDGHELEIASLGEGRPTIMTSWKFPLLIVAENSSRLEQGEFYLTSDDHLGLSKPMCRQSFLYQRLEKLIRNATKPDKDEIEKERARRQDEEEYAKYAKQQMYHMLFNFG